MHKNLVTFPQFCDVPTVARQQGAPQHQTTDKMKLDQDQIQTGEATYCPEDDKLRLYVGRVPRAEFEALRAEGWTSTPKQDCDFVAVWTPRREDTALAYGAGYIGDEDQDPADRAADRAERFAGYQDRRTGEALTHLDAYEDGPTVHGYQDPTRAERAAKRHDRQADKAGTQWSKAEYWQTRTAGVIRHALYKDLPGVRMGRIKRLESELRKHEKSHREATASAQAQWDALASIVEHAEGKREKMQAASLSEYRWHICRILEAEGSVEDRPTDEQTARAVILSALSGYRESERNQQLAKEAKDGTRPAVDIARDWLAGNPTRPEEWDAQGSRWATHYALRLAYENQMLGEQGGRLEQEDIQPGGKIGGKLVLKCNKSTATKRVVSVALLGQRVEGWAHGASNIPGTEWAEHTFKTERLSPDAYTPPTEATLAELAEVRATIKAAADKIKGKAPKVAFVNLTKEDAQRLADVWGGNGENASRARYGQKPIEPKEMTQADYSAASKGSYGHAETKEITGGGFLRLTNYNACNFPTVAKVRTVGGCPVHITDKPAKLLPASVWDDPRPAEIAAVMARFDELQAACRHAWVDQMTPEEGELFTRARRVGLAHCASASQFGITDKGKAYLPQRETVNA